MKGFILVLLAVSLCGCLSGNQKFKTDAKSALLIACQSAPSAHQIAKSVCDLLPPPRDAACNKSADEVFEIERLACEAGNNK